MNVSEMDKLERTEESTIPEENARRVLKRGKEEIF